jgi:hypothetical protein
MAPGPRGSSYPVGKSQDLARGSGARSWTNDERAAAFVLSCGHACAARSLAVASGPRRSSYRVGTSGDLARLGSGSAAVTLCGYGVGRGVDSPSAQVMARWRGMGTIGAEVGLGSALEEGRGDQSAARTGGRAECRNGGGWTGQVSCTG